ncbi:hypothetical protein MKEN_00205800 [Mycena kentingensis (nom. inval.)]|nr:hypothetical protein MKEN_00205800 [Mycena kentingensis (nom. inval.)]
MQGLLFFVLSLVSILAPGTFATETRCKPITLATLKTMPFWSTFWSRLGTVVYNNAHAFDGGKPSMNIDTVFDNGDDNAQVCSEGNVLLQSMGQPLCFKQVTYTPAQTAPPDGRITLRFPTGLTTVVSGEVNQTAAPLTAGNSYDVKFEVQDITPANTNPGGRNTATGTYSDVQHDSFSVEVGQAGSDYQIIHEDPGMVCKMKVDQTTCTQGVTGQATFSLWGAVRVGFNSRVNGHYYYYLRFDGWVPLQQLTVKSFFTGNVTTIGSNHHIPVCNGWN